MFGHVSFLSEENLGNLVKPLIMYVRQTPRVVYSLDSTRLQCNQDIFSSSIILDQYMSYEV